MVSRRFPKHRKFSTRKRKYGRRIITSRIRTSRPIHYYKRTVRTQLSCVDNFFTPLVSSAGVYNTYRLDQLPNYTDFTNLYDEYKINAISCKYIFDRNSSSIDNTGDIPRLLTVEDWNDATAPVGETEMLEYASFKSARLDKVVKRYFKAHQVLSGRTVSPQWNECTAAGVQTPHHGMKQGVVATANTGAVPLGLLNVYTTFYIACRNAK